jgi:oligopeptide/dipeptide ABC transporter ATP-binding protein
MPSLDGSRTQKLSTIPGQPPLLTAPPSSCPFAARCPAVHDRCRAANPPLISIAEGHDVACWLAEGQA